ncbi:pyridoxamine 5'-phosphate oxidase family protein (plasmid) [Rhizobium sp. WW22]|uniref:pyridoxamine 5'-phosphate oxidase family protein n=1 Tax=Rhizobium sp. WW22 TaxID=3389070 RepID=UPI000DD9FC3F
MNIQEMPYHDCIFLLRKQWLARLACANANIPYIVPIQYACAGDRLYAFTLPGKKLDIMRENPNVCVQIDQLKSKHSWKSVVIDAKFVELDGDESREERHRAWGLLAQHLDWWEPGALKPAPRLGDTASKTHTFFALDMIDVSGRATAN